MKDFVTHNQFAIQSISTLAGLAVGYDNYVLHESHHGSAEQRAWSLFKRLDRGVKLWCLAQAASLIVGHAAEAYLQSEGGLRAATDNTDAQWAHYFRPAASIVLAGPVVFFATNTEWHAVLEQLNDDSNKPAAYLIVKIGGGIAAIVHTAAPAVGFWEFVSASKCGWDTSWEDITPECDSSLVHTLSFWSKVGLLGLSIVGVGLMGGKGFLAATTQDVNEVAQSATKKLKLSEFRICHWNKKSDEEVGLTSGKAKSSYDAISQTNGMDKHN